VNEKKVFERKFLEKVVLEKRLGGSSCTKIQKKKIS